MISLIKNIINQLTGEPSFYHGIRGWQNIEAEDGMFPAVYLDEPITSYDDIKQSGYIEESYPLKMLFIGKSEPDWTPAQHQIVIADMRSLRKEFLNKLQQNDSIRHISDTKTTDVMNLFDSNVSGVFLEVTIYIYNQESIC